MRRAVLLWLAILTGGCAGQNAAPKSHLNPRRPALLSASVERGRTVFEAQCEVCHGSGGAGGQIGPPLRNEQSRKDLAATIAWIKNPEPPMPKLFPAELSEQNVLDVAAYVESL
jgi:mono/diheme cytochrome c family protein